MDSIHTGPWKGKNMLANLTARSIATIKAAARQLTGIRRREFQAQVTLDYCCGSPRRSEIVFGWGRETVCTGLGELRSGIKCWGNFSARGRYRTEEVLPHLEEDLRSLVDPQSQVEPEVSIPVRVHADDGQSRATGSDRPQGICIRGTSGRKDLSQAPESVGVSDATRSKSQTAKKKSRKPTPSLTTWRACIAKPRRMRNA